MAGGRQKSPGRRIGGEIHVTKGSEGSERKHARSQSAASAPCKRKSPEVALWVETSRMGRLHGAVDTAAEPSICTGIALAVEAFRAELDRLHNDASEAEVYDGCTLLRQSLCELQLRYGDVQPAARRPSSYADASVGTDEARVPDRRVPDRRPAVRRTSTQQVLAA